jgi:hypothetical protein
VDKEKSLEVAGILEKYSWGVENRNGHPIVHDQDRSELFLPFHNPQFEPITPGGIALKKVYEFYTETMSEEQITVRPLLESLLVRV